MVTVLRVYTLYLTTSLCRVIRFGRYDFNLYLKQGCQDETGTYIKSTTT